MDDLKLIKKHYGEKMMHFCRSNFPTILEYEGLLFNILSNTIAYSKDFYDDLTDPNQSLSDDPPRNSFIYLIYKRCKETVSSIFEKKTITTQKTPEELLDEAGYILYQCHSEEDIQSFKKYFASGEELCTFRGGRLLYCIVFFAVKKNVDEIKREDFEGIEKRQDEYGTSVISIQFSRGLTNTLSITNRYNHRVSNPDATFSNDLDNIIPGLTDAFENKYNLKINRSTSSMLELENYIWDCNGKLHHFNIELDGQFYCSNNVFLNYDRKPVEYEPEKYILMDNYLLDLVNKKISMLGINKEKRDSFMEEVIGDIKTIKVLTNKQDNTKTIIINGTSEITLNRKNEIIGYKNKIITKINDKFLSENRRLKFLSLPNVTSIGSFFLDSNKELKNIYLPKVRTIGNYFLRNNEKLETAKLPHAIEIGNGFISSANKIKNIELPLVEKITQGFLSNNKIIEKINIKNVREIPQYFLSKNRKLTKLELPKVEIIPDYFLSKNENLTYFRLSNAREIGDCVLKENTGLKSIYAPYLYKIGNRCLVKNRNLYFLYLPELRTIGDSFLKYDYNIKKMYIPKLAKIGKGVLSYWDKIEPENKISIQTQEKNNKKKQIQYIKRQKQYASFTH